MRDVGLPARHGLAVHRDVARITHPLPESCCAIERQHAAPQMPIQRRVAGLPPARRDDDAPAHRVPHRGRGSRVAHRVVVHRQGGAGRQQVAQGAQLGVGIGQVADQVGGQDPVERADDAVVGKAFHGGVHELDRRGPGFVLGFVEHAFGCVDRNDVGLRGDAQQRGCRCAGTASGVEQPQAAALVGQSQSLCRKTKVGMVSRAGTDEAVVGRCTDVERGRHISAGQTCITQTHVGAPIAAGRR